MNIKDYISSGILEAYVLGELSEQETTELEKNLKLYPELRAELSKVEEANEQLLVAAGVAPRAEVKENLFAKIDSSSERPKVIPLTTAKPFPIWQYAAAASITLAIISSYLAYDYRTRWKSASSQLTELIAQNQQMAENYNQVELELNKLEHDLDIIDNPIFHKVIMQGTPNAPTASASVYWNRSSQEVYLRIHNMKVLSKENQYQLWAIVDGKPVDSGVFDGEVSGLLKMKNVGGGAAQFAVTIEPRGGKTSPTLETMQVAGNVL